LTTLKEGELLEQLHGADRSHLELLPPQLATQRDVVLLADGQQLLDVVDLLAGLDDGQRDDVKHAGEGLGEAGIEGT
jgi:hypothetical protein